jgi:hypothetical protein
MQKSPDSGLGFFHLMRCKSFKHVIQQTAGKPSPRCGIHSNIDDWFLGIWEARIFTAFYNASFWQHLFGIFHEI